MRRVARRDDGACIALRGIVGHSCRGAIYERRSIVCREFTPGDADCSQARQGIGLSPLR